MIDREAIIIPGPRKCGTTTLFQMLKRHPSIDSAKIKEPQFLALDSNTVQENLSWYKSLFSNNQDKMMLDASTLYFSSDRAIKNIKNVFSDVKIIIILRDPAKRAYSAFWHMKKKVPPKEKREFDDIIKDIEGSEFEKIKKSEELSLQKAIEKNMIDPNYLNENYLIDKHNVDFKSDFEDPLWFYKYFQGSIYSKNLEAYKKEFGENVKLIFLEELIENPERVINNLIDFISIEKNRVTKILPNANKSAIPSRTTAKLVEKLKNRRCISNPIIRLINRANLEWIPRKVQDMAYSEKPNLDKTIYEKNKKIFSREYRYWKKDRIWKY